jgi:hypothetical protein
LSDAIGEVVFRASGLGAPDDAEACGNRSPTASSKFLSYVASWKNAPTNSPPRGRPTENS